MNALRDRLTIAKASISDPITALVRGAAICTCVLLFGGVLQMSGLNALAGQAQGLECHNARIPFVLRCRVHVGSRLSEDLQIRIKAPTLVHGVFICFAFSSLCPAGSMSDRFSLEREGVLRPAACDRRVAHCMYFVSLHLHWHRHCTMPPPSPLKIRSQSPGLPVTLRVGFTVILGTRRHIQTTEVRALCALSDL